MQEFLRASIIKNAAYAVVWSQKSMKHALKI